MPATIHSRKKDIVPTGSALANLAKLVAGGVVLLTVLLVSSLPALAQTGTVLESADYVFPDPNTTDGSPDPAV